MRVCSRAARASLALLLGGGCAGGPAPARPAASAVSKGAYTAQVLLCAPAEVPASLMLERAGDAERAAARFEETRGIVLTTLGLYLGTGRWAGAGASISGEPRPPRTGSEDECRALRAIAGGRTPPSFGGGEGAAREPLAVAGIVGVAYLPGRGAEPPRLLVRLAALLADADGAVQRAAPADVTAPYASPAPRYQERGAHEVAQDIVERAVPALSAAMK